MNLECAEENKGVHNNSVCLIELAGEMVVSVIAVGSRGKEAGFDKRD